MSEKNVINKHKDIINKESFVQHTSDNNPKGNISRYQNKLVKYLMLIMKKIRNTSLFLKIVIIFIGLHFLLGFLINRTEFASYMYENLDKTRYGIKYTNYFNIVYYEFNVVNHVSGILGFIELLNIILTHISYFMLIGFIVYNRKAKLLNIIIFGYFVFFYGYVIRRDMYPTGMGALPSDTPGFNSIPFELISCTNIGLNLVFSIIFYGILFLTCWKIDQKNKKSN
ncbi:MAG: hypothetical protein LBT75_05335 [Bacilli bacterium]|jgi:hypothetical protein|nr:hypothetical protein [Bacilli bacterium]